MCPVSASLFSKHTFERKNQCCQGEIMADSGRSLRGGERSLTGTCRAVMRNCSQPIATMTRLGSLIGECWKHVCSWCLQECQ